MILVDRRDGSKELIEPLRAMGLEVESLELPFGDVSFVGRGPKGPVEVGIEFKQLGECISSLRTERLQGFQAPGMREFYEFRWLLIEGEILTDSRGILQKRVDRRELRPLAGHMTLSEYNKRLLGLHLRGGLNPWQTRARRETLRWIVDLYRAWTDTAWDKHTSHLGIYQAPSIVPLSDFRQAVCRWPGIGIRTSAIVEQVFKGSVSRAATASAKTWAQIAIPDEEGNPRRFGPRRAETLVRFLQG